MASKFLEFPFAILGDLKEIPQDTDKLGTVSQKTGYGANYSLNIKDKPNEALRVERIFMNALFNQTETLLQEWQKHGASQWYATAPSGKQIAYDEGALVYHAKAIWQSQVAENVSEPSKDESKWKKIRPFSEEDIDALLDKRNFAEREYANIFKEENKFAKAITIGNANLTTTGDITGGEWGAGGLKKAVDEKAPKNHKHDVLDLTNVEKLARRDVANTFAEQAEFKKEISVQSLTTKGEMKVGSWIAKIGEPQEGVMAAIAADGNVSGLQMRNMFGAPVKNGYAWGLEALKNYIDNRAFIRNETVRAIRSQYERHTGGKHTDTGWLQPMFTTRHSVGGGDGVPDIWLAECWYEMATGEWRKAWRS